MHRACTADIVPALAALALAFAALALPASAPIAQELEQRIEQQQGELDRIKQEIEEHRRKTQKLGRQEKAVLGKLRDLEKEIDLSRSFVRNLSEQEKLLTLHVDSLRTEIVSHEAELIVQESQLGARLRQLYKRDPQYRWEILLGSESIDEAITRYRFLKIIAEQDAALLRDVREQKDKLEIETARLTESLADMAMVRAEREEEADKLEDNKEQREAMLNSIRNQKSQHAKAIKDLEKAQERVKDLIGALEKARLEDHKGYIGDGTFVSLKGHMMWPVKGKVIRGFGKIRHPKYGTVTFNNGVDIKAPAGEPIVAVAAGGVEFVDWIDAYGKCIILNHGDGYYTLYAHVATTFVAQGQVVSQGQVIAEVGDTGSLDGYVCHFEVRQSKKALDPTDWLAGGKKAGASR